MGVDDLEAGDLKLCTACICGDPGQQWLRLYGKKGKCDFDQEHGRNRKTLTVRRFAQLVDEDFRGKYCLGSSAARFSDDSDKMEYAQSGSPFREIMEEQLLCNPEIVDALADFLPDASMREIQKGAERFYDDTANYESIDIESSNEYDQDSSDASENPFQAPRNSEEIRAELLSKIEELQGEIESIRSRPAGMGHNRPPESFYDDNLDADLQEVSHSIAVVKRSLPTEDRELLVQEIQVLEKVESRWKGRFKSLGENAFSSMVKEAGKYAIKYAWDNGYFGDFIHLVGEKIHIICSLISEFVKSIL